MKRLFVQRLAGLEAQARPLRLTLVVNAEHVAGIIAEKVGGHAHRPLYRGGKGDDARSQYRSLPPHLLRLHGDHLFQQAVIAYAEGEGHLDRPPAGRGDLSLLFERAIILCERLQDHPRTSPLSLAGTCKTPFSSLPRKNRGLTSLGSV